MEDVKKRIKENKVIFKKDVDPEIREIIICMLQMAPKKRPTVQQVLNLPFIRGIRGKMDAVFFAQKTQIEKVVPKKGDLNEKLNHSNGTFFGGYESMNNGKLGGEMKSQKSKIEVGKWGLGSGNSKMNQSFDFKKKQYNSNFQSNQMNYIPEKNPVMYNSTRHITKEKSNYSRHVISSKKNDIFQNLEKYKPQIKSNKLFLSYSEKNGGDDKCITEPSSIVKTSSYFSGNGSRKISFYSKKKDFNVDVIRNDSMNLGLNMFKKKNKVVVEQVNGKKILGSYFGDLRKIQKSLEKRNSSKENNKNILSKKIEIQKKEVPLQSKQDLKLLLKKHKIDKKQKEFTIKEVPENSDKKKLSKNYITYKSGSRRGLNKSFNHEILGNKIKKNMLSRIQNGSKKGISHHSMAMPRKKLKQQKSVRYINCDWTKQSSVHHKSRSFNENTLRTKLVLRRKDSIQDLKKKLSNRQIQILKRPKEKIKLNISYQNSNQINPLPKNSKLGLKRNLSMATGVAVQIPKIIHGSEGKPIAQKSLQSVINNFNVSKQREATNVFQLQSSKRVPIKSFCFSHRVDNLNSQVKSRLKGFSQRNVKNEISFVNKSFQKMELAQNCSSRYQEPFVKPKYMSQMHQKWRKRFKSGDVKQGYSEIKTIDINS
jgi:hypothetical protein